MDHAIARADPNDGNSDPAYHDRVRTVLHELRAGGEKC